MRFLWFLQKYVLLDITCIDKAIAFNIGVIRIKMLKKNKNNLHYIYILFIF